MIKIDLDGIIGVTNMIKNNSSELRILDFTLLGIFIHKHPISNSEAIQTKYHYKIPKKMMLSEHLLVDVYETKYELRIITLLPGIEQERINYKIKDGIIEFCVHDRYGPIVIPVKCNVTPNSIKERSLTCTNSVLEIIFKKQTV